MSSAGGEGILTVTGWARFEKLHAEYNKLQQQVTKLETANKKITSESKRQEQVQQSTFGAWGLNVTRMVAGYASLHTAMQLITKELETQKRLQEGARRTDITLADAQKSVVAAVGGKATDAQFQSVMQQIEALSRQTKLPLTATTAAFGKVFSATEGGDVRARTSLASRALRESAPFFRDPEKIAELGDFAAAALDLKKGVPGLSPEQAVQIMNAVYSQSRLTDVANLKNLIPAAVNAQVGRPGANQFNNTLEALSLTAALGSRIGEPTGEKAATALSNLPEVMNKFAGKVVPGFENMSMFEAILAINERPELREKVKASVTGKGSTKGPQREFFDKLFSYQKAEEIYPELLVTPEDAARLNYRIDYGTPALQRATALREYSAGEQERVRRRYAKAGQVRALLFGGQVGGEEMVGGLTEGSQRFKWFGTPSLMASQALFDAAIKGGMEPREAGRRAIQVMQGGGTGTPAESAFYDRLLKAVEGNTEEVRRQRSAAEQQAVTTQNALQGAAAAFQGRNQQE